ncbi:hypothetical protein [Paenibacillus zanthoxyli]|uniref:hypothetical protein n=1 Tax=Paenibacillus zanthoxyli TaxID=369399 RepID=UPI0012EB8938|nr:hypothetical protein [Paenibacillus zanthoxyli]
MDSHVQSGALGHGCLDRPSGWQNSSSAVFFNKSVGYHEVPEIMQEFQLCGMNLRLNKPQKCTFTGALPVAASNGKKDALFQVFLPYPAHRRLIEVRIAWVGLPAAPVKAVNLSCLRSTIPEEGLPNSNSCAVIDA